MGMHQRKVNVLARNYCDIIKRKNKPVILSHGMYSSPGFLLDSVHAYCILLTN